MYPPGFKELIRTVRSLVRPDRVPLFCFLLGGCGVGGGWGVHVRTPKQRLPTRVTPASRLVYQDRSGIYRGDWVYTGYIRVI